jgi:hypothetical protein
MSAELEQKASRHYVKHGDSRRQRRLRSRGLAALDARTAEGREALAWRDAALRAKGSASCPFAIKTEIKLATFDLWRLLCLQTFLIADSNHRGTIVNRRKRELSRIHEQYTEIDARFIRRVEALQLDKAPVMDLARRLQQAQRSQETAGK